MKISIITVSYNAIATIEDTIKCVLAQSYENIEYIVVDGNSSDGTKEVISKYKNQISKIIIESDNGIYFAMNKGLSLATGDVIGILNADDLYADNDIIENVVTEFENANADALYGDLVYIKNNKVIRYWKSGKYSWKLFKFGWMPPHPTFFVKKEMYKRIGVFNTDFKLAADYELMLRFLYLNKISCVYLPKVLVKMNIGGESNKSLKNRILANSEDKKAWKVNMLKMPFYTNYLKPLLKVKQFIKF